MDSLYTPEFFRNVRETLSNIEKTNPILEGKGHLDHPEDLVILEDVAGAKRAVEAILKTANEPKSITIKWDGYPALIFGRDKQNNFSIMDKHMFNKKDMSARNLHSPEEFIQYDLNREADRRALHSLIKNIWSGLENASKSSKGYYWGDLLFGEPLKPKDGVYTFRPNPNGIAYTVEVDSEVGKLLTNKTAGIAVHQFIPAGAASTDEAQSLKGSIGNLKNNSDVAIVPSAMPTTPSIEIDAKLVSKANSAIQRYGNKVSELMQAPQARNSFNQLFTTYVNKKIVSGDLSNLSSDFLEYFENRPMTDSMRAKLSEHLNENKEGIEGLFAIWVAIYNLKNSVVRQLAEQAEQGPVKGYLQSGQQSQEGFVSQGLKFVDRMGFSRQNLQGR